MSGSVHVQVSCVKLEPLEDEQGEPWRGESTAAARTSLYAGHEIKQELIVGPEVLQPPDHAFNIEVKQAAITPTMMKMESDIIQVPAAMKQELIYKDPEFIAIKQEGLQFGDEEIFRESLHSEGILGDVLEIKRHPPNFDCPLDDKGLLTTTTSEESFNSKSSPSNVISAVETNTEIKTKSNKIDTNTKYSCDSCQKLFKYSQSLNAHKLIHLGIKPHSCDICKKKFLKKSDMERHIKRIHVSKKPFSCEVCMKQFAEASGLKRHERIHTGQTPYSCQTCNRQFRQAASLRRHKRSHTRETPYSCELCEKQFVDVSNYKRHKRTHTGEKPYSCKICHKQFSDSSCIKRHARTRHAHR